MNYYDCCCDKEFDKDTYRPHRCRPHPWVEPKMKITNCLPDNCKCEPEPCCQCCCCVRECPCCESTPCRCVENLAY